MRRFAFSFLSLAAEQADARILRGSRPPSAARAEERYLTSGNSGWLPTYLEVSMRGFRSGFLCMLITAAFTGAAVAQRVVTGQVMEAQTGQPLASVHVSIQGSPI